MSSWAPRLAVDSDVPQLATLIPISAAALQLPYYSAEQIEAAIGPIFAVDRQLIEDGTYFVVEDGETLVGAGGWSRRAALYGGDAGRTGNAPPLDPEHDAARVRAFFVRPGWERRGIGKALLAACEKALQRAGFRAAELAATLAGEPLYRACGYQEFERFEAPLRNGLSMSIVRMRKRFSPAPQLLSHRS